MANKKNILIAVDGSPHSFNAVRYVAQTFSPASLKVNLMHVMPTAPETFWDLEQDAYFKEKMTGKYTEWKTRAQIIAERFLENAKNLMTKANVPENHVDALLQERQEGIARDIISESKRGYDAVVIGRRGLSKIQDLFLGSVSQKIVETVEEIPVGVIGGDIRSKRMLIAVDASENSRNAVQYAGRLASSTEADLTIYHVVRKYGLGFLDDLHLRNEEVNGFMEQVEMDIKRMFRSYKSHLENAGVPPSRISTKRTVLSHSRSGDILREASDATCGTIVLGRRGLSKVHQFSMGRVTNKVLIRAAEYAVWIVP
jgi:nucleotide-binding universal stress UspA family protein